MANRYPLVVDTTNGNKIREIPNGDNLQLTGNSVIGVVDVTASGTVSANEINATSIKKGGTELATVAVTGAFSDITGGPTQLSDLTDDLNVLVPGDNVGTLTNNVGYLTTVAFADLTTTPTTLAGYGIIDAATLAQGGLASTAVQPGASVSVLVNDAGYLTLSDIQNGAVTIDVNNTGDLVGSVFADDSTILIDSILAAVNLDGTIRGHVRPNANQHNLWDLGTDAVRFKNAYFAGTVTGSVTGDVNGSLVLDGSAGIRLTTTRSVLDQNTLDLYDAPTDQITVSTIVANTIQSAMIGSVQQISGPGAIDVTSYITEITTTGADDYTLADGVAGQIKIISMIVDGGDATITPTTLATGTTITMADVNDNITLLYGTNGWVNTANQGSIIA